MPTYANPADKLINIASKPWSELNEGVMIKDLSTQSQNMYKMTQRLYRY